MKKSYLKIDPWKIIETDFDPKKVKSSESIFSLGNGAMGQRANFEESYTGATFQEVILEEFTIPIRLKWVGGKMGTLNILQKSSTLRVG